VLARLVLAGAASAALWLAALHLWPATFGRFWNLALWGLAGALVFAGAAALVGMLQRKDVRAMLRLANPVGLLRELRGR
jgi:hypothetical protein